MNRYRCLHGLLTALALTVAAALPAFAVSVVTTPAGETTVTTETTTEFQAPVATPMGQGWYAAASNTTQDAWMARGTAWSNDLVRVRGIARAAAIDGDMMTTAGLPAATQAGLNDRLVTGVAQWIVPEEDALYEVRFVRLDSAGPFGGVGVLRAVHGGSGIGIAEFPETLSPLNVRGAVTVFRNGQQIATGLTGSFTVTQGIRASDTGQLLRAADVHPEQIQIHLLVQGDIPGRTGDSLYVFWPQATLDLRNLSQPVALLPSELEVARGYFTPPVAVAGFREPTGYVPLLMISLREPYLARSTAQIAPGPMELRVINESMHPRGFFIQGPGIQQRTPLLNPGQEMTLQLNLTPGTYQIAAFGVAEPGMSDLMHWDTIVVR